MSKKIDLIGQVFGRLTVVSEKGKGKSGNIIWECTCCCGNTSLSQGGDLKRGNTKSCGCLRKETHTTHGLRGHPMYTVWSSMKKRCYAESGKRYQDYGGRGVKVCDRWISSLENFIEDTYEGYEKGLQLDRIDNNGDYEPENIRWVTPQQNVMNRRSFKNSSSIYKGVSWAKKSGKWSANIQKDGKYQHLGLFTNEIEAALAYNEAAEELFGEFANLNQIETTVVKI
jgi:hypothetical protein